MRQPLPVARLRSGLQAWGLADAEVAAIPPGVTADVFVVTRGTDRWVGKYAYDSREYFEVGLKVSALLRDDEYAIAAPCLTIDGELVTMVEWPDGVEHPLALLRWVDGRALRSDDPGAPELRGSVCGWVHAQLLDVEPAGVGLTVHPRLSTTSPDEYEWELGAFGWLNQVNVDLARVELECRSGLRHSVAVWDGPDIHVDADRVGLIDFGHTSWHPLIHVVANRSLSFAQGDPNQLERFLAAVQVHLPLSTAELEALVLYQLINATIYARWAANQIIGGADHLVGWHGSLVTFLRTNLPKVCLAAPPA